MTSIKIHLLGDNTIFVGEKQKKSGSYPLLLLQRGTFRLRTIFEKKSY